MRALSPGDQRNPVVADARLRPPQASVFGDPQTLRTPVPAYAAPSCDRCILTVLAGEHVGAMVAVRDEEVLIGRAPEAMLRFSDLSVSRRHARVFRVGGDVVIEDLGSTNGTIVRGQHVSGLAPLADGDRVGLGGVLLKVSFEDALEERASLELYECAVRDPLTGVHNRRYLGEQLAAELAFASRHTIPLSVLLIDIDHFKHVNDAYGHEAGDAVLRRVAEMVGALVRPEDILARYGGDELVIIARETDSVGAVTLGERVRRAVAEAALPFHAPVTVSVGVATLAPPSSVGPVELLAAADRGMYLAKSRGRDCVAKASL